LKKKNAYILGSVFLAISVVFSVLTKIVDVGVSKCVPDTKIGFSAINNGFHTLTGYNMTLYNITDVMGIIAIGFGLIFGLEGLIQWITRKNLFKLDRYIYCLGSTYALLGILYVLFEKIAVNYRPIIMEGETVAEASFPSSHTLLICAIITTGLIQVNRLFAGKKALVVAFDIFGALYFATAVTLRLLSGVHWLTDIVASLLITTSITFFYYAASKEEKGKHSKTND